MFEEQGQPTVGGPIPPPPIAPFSGGQAGLSIPISPERTPPLPPLRAPQQPQSPVSKRRGKRLLLIILLVVILLGGGIAVAAFLFPGTPAADTGVLTNGNTNTGTANVNKTNANSNTNAIVNKNTNGAVNQNTNAAANTNTASNQNANASSNQNTNAVGNLNVNSAANTNSTTNAANTNAAANTNSNRPASYSVDSDGDGMNNYLEDWLGTNKNNADADGDGFPDGKEVVSGFSPIGTGELRVVGFEASCAESPLLKQYGLPSTDISSLCGIGGDLLANVQVMVSNPEFFQDLDQQRSAACTSFAKLEKNICASVLTFELLRYMTTPKAS